MTGKQAVQRGFVYQRPWLYEKQLAAIFDERRYSWIEGSTKCGKTQPSLAWLFEQSVYMAGKGRAFWWISPVSSQADICFNRMKNNIPRQIIQDVSESKKYVELIFGSVLWFKSADKPDSLYGDDVYAAVIDEASRVKADAFTAVRSTLTATNGRLRLIGNVKGRNNWFYKGCRAAEMGLPDHGYHKMTAYDAVDAGILSLSEVEDAKVVLPDHVFKQLYLAEPADDGGNPFGLNSIDACIRPMSLKPPVVWGIDVAKSYDWTVLIGLDEDGRVCRFHRFQLGWPETKSQIKKCVGNKTPALMDSTGVGDPLLDDLHQDGFDNIEGFKFTSPSKQQLMEGLAADIQQQTVGYPEGEIATELRVFEYEYTRTGVKYTAPSGLHDDCVCALALARKKLHAPKPFVYIPE